MHPPLRNEVKQAINHLVRDIYPLWKDRALLDLSRVWHRGDSGQLSVNIAPSSGMNTIIAFNKKIENRKPYTEFIEAVQRHQSSLFQFIVLPSMSASLRYPEMWVRAWCQYLDRKLRSYTLDEAITCLTHDIDALITSEVGVFKTLTPVNGLSLPNGLDSLDLDGLVVRNLTPEEFTEISQTDVTDIHGFDQQMMQANVAVFQKFPTTVRICEDAPTEAIPHEPLRKAEAGLTRFSQALHVLKAGTINYVTTTTRIKPAVLPLLTGSRFGLSANRWNSTMQLSDADVARLRVIWRHLANSRPEVGVAAARLVDAESRSSPADTILDCTIGLETLLNSSARDELTFRVRLNYSFLGRPEERASRSSDLTRLYRERGRIVHGGMKSTDLHPSESAWRQLSLVAEQGKNCLRDTINRFLDDPELRVSAELDSDFWLKRIVGG